VIFNRPVPKIVLATAMLLPLFGCDTFGIGASGPPVALAPRPLDTRTDTLADLVVAFDLPAGVQPVQTGMIARFDITTAGKGARHVKAPLGLADGEDVDSGLPALPPGHTYYLFGFVDKDKAALSAAQQWLRALPPTAAPVAAFAIDPKLCQVATIDPATASFSVQIAPPAGSALVPLIATEPIASLPGGGVLPNCVAG
jgi:hypothetical protein